MDSKLLRKIAKDYETLGQHHLAGYIYARGIDLSPDYRARYKEQFARNALLLQTMTEIDVRLARSRMRPVLLGGAALVESTYKNLGERNLPGIDFLISENERHRIRGILRSLGFQELPTASEFLIRFVREDAQLLVHVGKVFVNERKGSAWRSTDSPLWDAFRVLAPADQLVEILGEFQNEEQSFHSLIDAVEFWKTHPGLSMEDVLKRAAEKKRLGYVRAGLAAIKRSGDFRDQLLRPYRWVQDFLRTP